MVGIGALQGGVVVGAVTLETLHYEKMLPEDLPKLEIFLFKSWSGVMQFAPG